MRCSRYEPAAAVAVVAAAAAAAVLPTEVVVAAAAAAAARCRGHAAGFLVARSSFLYLVCET